VIGTALRYEWVRLRTLRSTWWLTGVALTLYLFSGLNALFQRPAAPDGGGTLSADFLGTSATLGAEITLVPVIGVLAAFVGLFAFGHEFRYATIRVTLVALPDRRRVFCAKALVTAAWALGIGVAGVALVLLLAFANPWQAVTASSLAWEPFGRAVCCHLALLVLWDLAGLSVACLVRNLPAAVALLLVWPLLVEKMLALLLRTVSALHPIAFLAPLLPFGAGERSVAVLLPAGASGLLSGGDLGPLDGLGVFAGFVLVLAVISLVAFRRADC
jgi:ABC-2 type transport system permease protein